ncbi:MAG: hypothetical protein KBC69_00435 [Candidatus Magasanikbacteria bacterium]|nr:hypothetical protein [Candidatus Magasanikbacteria bacterium]
MDKRVQAINFLISHKDLAVLLISRLYPLDKKMLKKYKNKLEKKETETQEIDKEEYAGSDSEGRWDEDNNLHEHGCGCSECKAIETERREKEYAMTPEDHYYESDKFIEDTKNDWIYLGPWREDLELLMEEFGIKGYEGVGNEILEKVFKPVLDKETVNKIVQ